MRAVPSSAKKVLSLKCRVSHLQFCKSLKAAAMEKKTYLQQGCYRHFSCQQPLRSPRRALSRPGLAGWVHPGWSWRTVQTPAAAKLQMTTLLTHSQDKEASINDWEKWVLTSSAGSSRTFQLDGHGLQPLNECQQILFSHVSCSQLTTWKKQRVIHNFLCHLTTQGLVGTRYSLSHHHHIITCLET